MEVADEKEIREEEGLAAADPAAPNADLTDLEKLFKGERPISSIAIVGMFLLAMIAFFYFAKVFFLPIVLAIILSFLFKPVVKCLARIKVPQPLGAAIVLVGALLLLSNGASQLAKPATEFIDKFPESLRQVENKLRNLVRQAERLTRAAAQVQEITRTSEETSAPKVEVKRTSLPDNIFSATTSFLAGAIETLVLLYFLLASGELFLQKLVKVLPNFHEKKKATEIAHEVQQNISAFLFTVTLINLTLGGLVGLGVWMAGLSNPILWGAAAALLNFVPYFGPIVGVCLLAFAGLMSFQSLGHALIPPAIYLGLHALEANFLTPTILGRRLTLNPILIFISFMFWTWLWGIPGALLSVPLLMILKIFCDHFKSLAAIGEFLSGGRAWERGNGETGGT